MEGTIITDKVEAPQRSQSIYTHGDEVIPIFFLNKKYLKYFFFWCMTLDYRRLCGGVHMLHLYTSLREIA